MSKQTVLIAAVLLLTISKVAPEDVKPISIVVYYESLCPHSRYFVGHQLPAALRQFPEDLLNITLIPWGDVTVSNTSTSLRNISCQHGPDECWLNKLQVCAENILEDRREALEISFCIMVMKPPKRCIEVVDVDFDKLEECASDDSNNDIMRKNMVMTQALQPRLDMIPRIVIQGKDVDYSYAENLVDYICEHYKDRVPSECEEVANNKLLTSTKHNKTDSD